MSKVRWFSAGLAVLVAAIIVAGLAQRWRLMCAAMSAASALQVAMIFTLGGYYQNYGYSFSRAERPGLFWAYAALASALSLFFLFLAIFLPS